MNASNAHLWELLKYADGEPDDPPGELTYQRERLRTALRKMELIGEDSDGWWPRVDVAERHANVLRRILQER